MNEEGIVKVYRNDNEDCPISLNMSSHSWSWTELTLKQFLRFACEVGAYAKEIAKMEMNEKESIEDKVNYLSMISHKSKDELRRALESSEDGPNNNHQAYVGINQAIGCRIITDSAGNLECIRFND